MQRDTFACAIALLASYAFAGPSGTAAQGEPFSLWWSAPEGCPDARSVESEILRLAGHAPASPLAVHATVTHDAERYRLEIMTRSEGGEGSRTIEAASCDTIAEAAALIVALAIDPEAAARAAASSAPRAPGPATAPESTRASGPATAPEAALGSAPESARDEPALGSGPATTPPGPGPATALTPTPRASQAEGPESEPDDHATAGATATPPSAAAFSFVASAHATLGLALLPAPAPGIGIGLGARLEPIELWIAGTYLGEQGVVRGAYTASFWHAAARIRGCVAIALGTPIVELAPCAGLHLGVQGGRGDRVPFPRAESAMYGGAEALLDLRIWIVGAIAISVIPVAIEIPFDRPRFVVAERDGTPALLHRPEPMGVFGGVGLLVRAP